MRYRVLASLSTLLLVIAACGGGTTSTTGTSNGDDQASSGDDTTQESQEGTSSSSGEPDSLADFFGGGDDPEAQQANFRDQEARVQESIRQCMAEQGFEYQPVLPPESAFQAMGPQDQEERVRTQGFGVTTWYGDEERMGMDEEWVDPNQETVESMSDSEREAWQEALYGTQEEREEMMDVEVDEETGETMRMGTGFGPGCQGEAMKQEYGDQEDVQALWQELQPAMEEMQQRVEADPRIVELNEEWSACMAGAGHEYESRTAMQQSVFQDFQQRLEEIVGPNMGFSDPFEGWTQEEIEAFFEENSQEEIDAFMAEAEEEARADVDMEAVEALQQEEIDLAVADFECAEGWEDAYMEVRAEYESDFIADNRDTLEQIREAQGG